MSDFLRGFGFGLALSTRCNFGGFGFGYGFGRYTGIPSTRYLQTCYVDLEQPTGLSTLVDGGWALNGGYRCAGGYSGFSSPMVFRNYTYTSYNFGLGGRFGMYC